MFCRRWIPVAFILRNRVNTISNPPLISASSDNSLIDVSQFSTYAIKNYNDSLYTPFSSTELLKYSQFTLKKYEPATDDTSSFNPIEIIFSVPEQRKSLLTLVDQILLEFQADKMKILLKAFSDDLDKLCMNPNEQVEFRKYVKRICKETPSYEKIKADRPDSCATFCPKLILNLYFGYMNSYITDLIERYGYKYGNKIDVYSRILLFYDTEDFLDIIGDDLLRSKDDKRVIDVLNTFNEYMGINYMLLAYTLYQLDALYVPTKISTWTERYRIYFIFLSRYYLFKKRLQVHFNTLSKNSCDKSIDIGNITLEYTVGVVARGKTLNYEEEELENLIIKLIDPLGRKWNKADQKYLDKVIRNIEGLENSDARLNKPNITLEYNGKRYILNRVFSLFRNNTPLFVNLDEQSDNINVPLYTFTSGYVEKIKISSQVIWTLTRQFDDLLDHPEIMKTHTREIIKSLLYSLQNIHSNNVFHGDVSLKNIVFTREKDKLVFLLNNFDIAQKSENHDGIQTKILYYRDMYGFLSILFELRDRLDGKDEELDNFISFIEGNHINGKQYSIQDLLNLPYITQKKGIMTTAKSIWKSIFGRE